MEEALDNIENFEITVKPIQLRNVSATETVVGNVPVDTPEHTTLAETVTFEVTSSPAVNGGASTAGGIPATGWIEVSRRMR